MSLTDLPSNELPVELDVEGPSSPPRANGELVFAEPWESRAFGLTIALHQDGLFSWDDFKDRLIAAIARWEAAHPDGEGYRYYTCWLEALQTLLDDRQILPVDDVQRRAAELARRPPGHDHDHDHDHEQHVLSAGHEGQVAEGRRTAPVEARWLGGYRAAVTTRQFTVEVDEPPSAGGTDAGPMPTEYLLISLSSCFALAIAHVARRDGVEVGPFSVTAQGVYDGPCLSDVELSIRMEGPLPTDMDALLTKARRVCYVSNTLARQPSVTAHVVD